VKDYKLGEVPVHVLKGISFEIERGDFCLHHGAVRIGKVHPHEYSRVSR
jgi:hypothetical protein